MFGALGRARGHFGELRVAGRSCEQHGRAAGLQKRLVAVKGTRTVSKKDLLLNDYLPKIEVDPDLRSAGRRTGCSRASAKTLR